MSSEWNSKFAQFVKGFGVEKLARCLGVTSSAIYHWSRGVTLPKQAHARELQRLASELGVTLTMDEIYEQTPEGQEVYREFHERRKVRAGAASVFREKTGRESFGNVEDALDSLRNNDRLY